MHAQSLNSAWLATPPGETRSQVLRHVLEHAAHLLPTQGPIGVFIHHNTLHAFEGEPFEKALIRAAAMFDAEIVDVVETISSEFPRSALVVILATLLILAVLLRSILLPIKAVLMNTLSILASFGALVWIFQEGNLSALLGFAPLGFVETTIPVILFCVLFGLSMDYEVFLLTRMREIYDRTGDNTAAVAGGLERSGRIITSAALIVVVVAGSFVFAEIVLIKALGVGVAIAVALDATIVRALLVPATMRLVGNWNWWEPRWMTRILAGRIASEAEAEAGTQ